jgi:uncharacterized protein (DUF58 family)
VKAWFTIVTTLLLLFVAYLYRSWHPGFASSFIFTLILIVSVYLCFTWFSLFFGLSIERSLYRKRLDFGAVQEVKVVLNRTNWLPVAWYKCIEDLTRVDGTRHKTVILPWFRKQMIYSYTLKNLNRGYYQLNHLELVSGDVFGFLQRSKLFALTHDFFVYPKILPAQQLLIRAGGTNNGVVQALQLAGKDQNAITGIRDHQHGDRLNQIQWKASARIGELKTKEFVQETTDHFLFCLDTFGPVYPHGEDFEEAVSLAASLIYYAKRSQLRFGFTGVLKDGTPILLSGSDEQHFHKIMDTLATIDRQDAVDLSAVIHFALPQIPKGSPVILITTSENNDLKPIVAELRVKQWKTETWLIGKQSKQEGVQQGGRKHELA